MIVDTKDVAFEVVTTDLRNQNSRAVQRRDRWRHSYANITKAIKAVKNQLRTRHVGASRAYLMANLRAMQVEASRMMYVREQITLDLRLTAYRYAPSEWMRDGPPG